jgi:hypothetical protein
MGEAPPHDLHRLGVVIDQDELPAQLDAAFPKTIISKVFYEKAFAL